MKNFIFFCICFFCLSILFLYSSATTFTTSQDGEWEDSSSWNNIAVADTLDGDTIIIRNHIDFNNNIVLSNCYLRIDSSASICGHDSIWFFHSTMLLYGGFYADYVYGDDSKWAAYNASWLVTYLVHWGGYGAGFLVSNCTLAKVGGCFICNVPVELCPDTTQIDTTQTDTTIIPSPKPPLSISVYPNPSLDHFTIDSEVPDSNSHITANIYDLIGRKMKTISIPNGKSSLTIFTNSWAAGMYLLRFQQGETIIQTDKIIRVQ
ncbi:MAG TPA: T9SS type A sorting domain-containing protein [Chitinophagales bacterium]|nr:T9SS type A sorting domain-containing protein [Chitinophagales bacterium]